MKINYICSIFPKQTPNRILWIWFRYEFSWLFFKNYS